MIETFPWNSYSKKLVRAIVDPQHAGKVEEEKEGYRRCVGKEEGLLSIYLLVRESDGVIHEAKFSAFGETLLIGALEIVCELAMMKNYGQARRISSELIENQVVDKVLKKGFPKESAPFINLVLECLDEALLQCAGLPLPVEFEVTPLDLSELKNGEYPNWELLSLNEKLSLINEVLTHEITPYVQLDGGGVKIKELKNDIELTIIYEGSCTSCMAATGSTLSAIEQILRARIHPRLVVIPDL